MWHKEEKPSGQHKAAEAVARSHAAEQAQVQMCSPAARSSSALPAPASTNGGSEMQNLLLPVTKYNTADPQPTVHGKPWPVAGCWYCFSAFTQLPHSQRRGKRAWKRYGVLLRGSDPSTSETGSCPWPKGHSGACKGYVHTGVREQTQPRPWEQGQVSVPPNPPSKRRGSSLMKAFTS